MIRKLIFGFLLVAINISLAQEATNTTIVESTATDTIPNYAQSKQALEFIHQLAKEKSLDEAYLISLLMAVHRDDEVLAKMNRPAEKTKPWYEYKKIFDDADRLKKGKAFFQENRGWLEKAYRQYGVDPAIITAIIGVETRYGKVTGKTPVLQALSTLCFDYPKRAEFFCSELKHYLLLAQREDWNPLAIQGSYAGALGMAQFMPSSYTNDAIDFDGDGKVDLWNSPADAIGSIANYLKNRGWEKDGALFVQLPIQPSLENFGTNHKPYLLLHAIAEDKLVKNDENLIKWLDSQYDELVGTLTLQGENQNLPFITYNNFYVITRYNTSPMYAMAVSELAAKINNNLNQESTDD
ncbi:lytic murein transglycosylase B [Suttonella ornithocola]|uniref:Membrane-bound lytic murein transglycosylase B n=1 Tax=Suttonella ornithocola TaxID=279832 RepID=A0A380MS84_9GAMM|nr:lytic murein transglycosylase B [Suttonella ornithocola]SUO95450.1 Membrane-bound lytic murein transglycosylase B precursor [Suttonella ornithocola]